MVKCIRAYRLDSGCYETKCGREVSASGTIQRRAQGIRYNRRGVCGECADDVERRDARDSAAAARAQAVNDVAARNGARW